MFLFNFMYTNQQNNLIFTSLYFYNLNTWKMNQIPYQFQNQAYVTSQPIFYEQNQRGRSLQSKVTNSRILHSAQMVASRSIKDDNIKQPMVNSHIIRDQRWVDQNMRIQEPKIIYKAPQIVRVMQSVTRKNDSELDKLKQMNNFLIDNYTHLHQRYTQLQQQRETEEEFVDQAIFWRNALPKIQSIFQEQLQHAIIKMNKIGNYQKQNRI